MLIINCPVCNSTEFIKVLETYERIFYICICDTEFSVPKDITESIKKE